MPSCREPSPFAESSCVSVPPPKRCCRALALPFRLSSARLVSVDVGADLRVVPAFAVDLGPQRDLVVHARLFHDAAFLNEELWRPQHLDHLVRQRTEMRRAVVSADELPRDCDPQTGVAGGEVGRNITDLELPGRKWCQEVEQRSLIAIRADDSPVADGVQYQVTDHEVVDLSQIALVPDQMDEVQHHFAFRPEVVRSGAAVAARQHISWCWL